MAPIFRSPLTQVLERLRCDALRRTEFAPQRPATPPLRLAILNRGVSHGATYGPSRRTRCPTTSSTDPGSDTRKAWSLSWRLLGGEHQGIPLKGHSRILAWATLMPFGCDPARVRVQSRTLPFRRGRRAGRGLPMASKEILADLSRVACRSM